MTILVIFLVLLLFGWYLRQDTPARRLADYMVREMAGELTPEELDAERRERLYGKFRKGGGA